MLKYSIAMGVRIICIVLLLFVHGWWLLVVAVGALVLPYFAVVIANVAPNTRLSPVERPGLIVDPSQPESSQAEDASAQSHDSEHDSEHGEETGEPASSTASGHSRDPGNNG